MWYETGLRRYNASRLTAVSDAQERERYVEAEFIEIITKMVAERGKDDLFDTKRCMSVIADLTRNKFKRERNLLFPAIESGAAKAIYGASESDLQICKLRQIRKLEEEYNLRRFAAEEVVNMLALILREDDTTTVIPQLLKPVDSQKPPPPPESGKDYSESQYGIDMVYVKGGKFMMGATPEQGSDCPAHEKPAHEVTLSDFYIGKYPVTQAQWKAVMDKNPSHFKGDNLPVEFMSWNDAHEFIRKLNRETGRDYRLPTEAEWEYAARGGNRSRGYKYSGSDDIEEVAWYLNNSGYKMHCVGTKKANELGIYDMSGNVWEWVGDWDGKYCGSPQTNPHGPADGSHRVVRGGSWDYPDKNARVSSRYYRAPGLHLSFLGFRLARSS